MQRIADLETQGVPRAEAARCRAAFDDRVPERPGVLGHDHQLDARLSGVAGAVDHHLDPDDLAHLPRERGSLVEAEPLERARTLHSEERELVALVAEVGPGAGVLEDPLEVGFAVPGIDDQDEPAALDAVDDQVVDDPAALVRQKRVLGTADVA